MAKIGHALSPHIGDTPTDHLSVQVRAYVTLPSARTGPKSRKDQKSVREGPSEWSLIFDCETRTTPDQALRFGAYQLRQGNKLRERGLFYDPATLTEAEERLLRETLDADEPGPDGELVYLRTRDQFVEQVFYQRGYMLGACIVAFNLPFDIARIALGSKPSRRDMKGGFTFTLIDNPSFNPVSVKHLSQRSAWIRFVGTQTASDVQAEKGGRQDDDTDSDIDRTPSTDRGFFVDVKTLAAALMSESYTLERLCRDLKTATRKTEVGDHGASLTLEYVEYALKDVQVTWECFCSLKQKFEALGLHETGLHELYSEASLGKAYLKAMGIKPWREVQPEYSPIRIGQIMSTYYGGRSEVHIRRQPIQVLHCDFLSMYPTTCSLMGLWKFVIADGMQEVDDTEAIKKLVDRCTPEKLLHAQRWRGLAAIVQVLPKGDLFPVRARYGDDKQATIGLNHLTNVEPMWFTLPDVLVSKILTGKTPKILRAVRFEPRKTQDDLNTVSVAGHQIRPTEDDFYRSLIERRLELEDQKEGASEELKARLEADRKAIKILANSTSYGIFVELNIREYAKRRDMRLYGIRGRPAKARSAKLEQPGRYFHPLLGTLITGAARLMLALAERQVIDQGLDWAFCDTDSMAIANPGLASAEFLRRALKVQTRFGSLNPYGRSESILRLEKINFPKGSPNSAFIDPLWCLAVSAKRYVLYNRATNGACVTRKASGHGLGHLLPPYDEGKKAREERIRSIGVPLWQDDLWNDIVRASQTATPDIVAHTREADLLKPAASRYGATNTTLHQWFRGYNGKGTAAKRYADQVKPFNFLLAFHSKSRLEMIATDRSALRSNLWRRRIPSPAAPFYSDVRLALPYVFDRELPQRTRIPENWLESYRRNLAQYHLHPERKFLGTNDDSVGPLQRRHVEAISYVQIGKEADNIEEREVFGDAEGDAIVFDDSLRDAKKLRVFVLREQRRLGISNRALCDAAGVSTHTLAIIREGSRIRSSVVVRLADAIERLVGASTKRSDRDAARMNALASLHQQSGSLDEVARRLGLSRSYVARLIVGARPLTDPVRRLLDKFADT